MRDEGRPLEPGLQDQGSNHRKLLRPNGRGGERSGKRQGKTLSGESRGDERKRTADAERFLADLRERLGRFALTLHPEKTRLIEFGRCAAENRARRGLGKPETF